jgi:uncharacterized protein (DUF1501 family)
MGTLGTNRRSFLGTVAGAAWLTPMAWQLARAADHPQAKGTGAKSVIILWMQGGPSQLETFDPKPKSQYSGGTTAIATNVKGIELAAGLPLLAEQMNSLSLIRSMTSKEGDHERGTYTLKTGFRPDPTITHPSIGSIICHELPSKGTDIPRHVSILSSQWPARGGFLGEKYDAFLTDDPNQPVPDTMSYHTAARDKQRLGHLDVVESAFSKGRSKTSEATGHRRTMSEARAMMSSEQLKAFDVSQEPLATRKLYGDTPFGRACLAARRLTEVGVRCVEVTLAGWDTHANNHEFCAQQNKILDPAFAGLMKDLKDRKLLENTLVVCLGEFGRTPTINGVGGRDHWPMGFSVAIGGGGLRTGHVIGETNPDIIPKPSNPNVMMNSSDKKAKESVVDPVTVEDLSATILASLGIEHDTIQQSPIGRTVKYSEGTPIQQLLKKA